MPANGSAHNLQTSPAGPLRGTPSLRQITQAALSVRFSYGVCAAEPRSHPDKLSVWFRGLLYGVPGENGPAAVLEQKDTGSAAATRPEFRNSRQPRQERRLGHGTSPKRASLPLAAGQSPTRRHLRRSEHPGSASVHPAGLIRPKAAPRTTRGNAV